MPEPTVIFFPLGLTGCWRSTGEGHQEAPAGRGPPLLHSDLKRAPVHRLMTRLADEQRAAGITCRRRVPILNVLGLRAQESARRALLAPFACDDRASNQTVRLVDQWLPIHGWDTRPHPIYAAGMPRKPVVPVLRPGLPLRPRPRRPP